LTDEAAGNLSGVLRRIGDRIRQEAPPELADKMRAATVLLLGLRYEEAFTQKLLREIIKMDPIWEEFSTYQMLISRGRDQGVLLGKLEEARTILQELGEEKWGQPDAATVIALEAINNEEQLRKLIKQVQRVNSWQDLLTTA
jgi:hypothetical protein